MRKSLGFYKSASEAFNEGLIREVLNGSRNGLTINHGEQLFAGVMVTRQIGFNPQMYYWLFATNHRLIIWQHKSLGSVDDLKFSDCEAIEFKDIEDISVGVQKVLGGLPITPCEEIRLEGIVTHLTRTEAPSTKETWYLQDRKSGGLTADRLVQFLKDSASNADCNINIRNRIGTSDKFLAWSGMISLGLGLFVGGPSLMLSEYLANKSGTELNTGIEQPAVSPDRSTEPETRSSDEQIPEIKEEVAIETTCTFKRETDNSAFSFPCKVAYNRELNMGTVEDLDSGNFFGGGWAESRGCLYKDGVATICTENLEWISPDGPI